MAQKEKKKDLEWPQSPVLNLIDAVARPIKWAVHVGKTSSGAWILQKRVEQSSTPEQSLAELSKNI